MHICGGNTEGRLAFVRSLYHKLFIRHFLSSSVNRDAYLFASNVNYWALCHFQFANTKTVGNEKAIIYKKIQNEIGIVINYLITTLQCAQCTSKIHTIKKTGILTIVILCRYNNCSIGAETRRK